MNVDDIDDDEDDNDNESSYCHQQERGVHAAVCCTPTYECYYN